jgi:copper chaperone CopZ
MKIMNLKTIGLITLLIGLILFTLSVLADVTAARIKINENDECIEKVMEAAKTVDGVIQIDWNKETLELEIVFEDDKTNLNEIETAISDAGFDTPNFKAVKNNSDKGSEGCADKVLAE